jgi:hypothetical protein
MENRESHFGNSRGLQSAPKHIPKLEVIENRFTFHTVTGRQGAAIPGIFAIIETALLI